MKICLLGDPEGLLKEGFQTRGCDFFHTTEKISAAELQKLNPSWVISYNYRHLISKDSIDIMKSKILNLHISYLPWNRGADPNPWCHLDNTPAGVSVHQIDVGIDTGPILSQKKIDLAETMTLRESYDLLNAEVRNLFWSIWPGIEDSFKQRKPQTEQGTFHSTKDRARFEECLGKAGWDISIAEFKKVWAGRSKLPGAVS